MTKLPLLFVALAAVILAACSASPGKAPSVAGATAPEPTATPWASTQECPLTPVHVAKGAIPGTAWRDPFGSGTVWYKSEDNQLWAMTDASWRAGKSVRNKVPMLKPKGAHVEVTGTRLDGDGQLTALVGDGYPDDFQASVLMFPSPGCWEIEARAGDSLLRFVVYVYRDPVP